MVTSERLELQKYLVYFKMTICTIGAKDPAHGDKAFPECAHKKRERGDSSPRATLCSACPNAARCLGRQNLAALCTAAGENLAAVGSCHSLAETVNLGSVATVGLIGTLHSVHLLEIFLYARQSFDRSSTYFLTIHGHSYAL